MSENKLQPFKVGDTIDVGFKIKEGDRERVQHFTGVVIAKKGTGISQTFTVRKIATGEIGVERIFPLLSPFISSIKVKKAGKVRRAKLYYLRSRKGKAAMKVKSLIHL